MRFIVIGSGRHARSVLIPNLIANSKVREVFSVNRSGKLVVEKSSDAYTVKANHRDLLQSDPELRAILCSGPNDRLNSIDALPLTGRVVFIEKPISEGMTASDFNSILGGSVIVPGYMYCHTPAYEALSTLTLSQSCFDITVEFHIPSFPPGGWRAAYSPRELVNIDLACYVVPLLFDGGISLDNIRIFQNGHPEGIITEIFVDEAGKRLHASFGVGFPYRNRLRVREPATGECEPFFWGRNFSEVNCTGILSKHPAKCFDYTGPVGEEVAPSAFSKMFTIDTDTLTKAKTKATRIVEYERNFLSKLKENLHDQF